MKKMKLPGFGRKTTLNIDFSLIFRIQKIPGFVI